MAIHACDDTAFRILDKCLEPASGFITAAHSRGAAVLVHCMAGVNRFAQHFHFVCAQIDQRFGRALMPLCLDRQHLSSDTYLFQKIGEPAPVCAAARSRLMFPIRRPLLPLAADCIAVRPAILQVLFQAFCITLHSHNVAKNSF